ncbi:serine/arginine repetitive matrix protein 2-like isoform X2 [Bacillus rossius redtenbacheri]|uniref:serine/arginine repetitive matrix protein 2-like isoform X2 n=1 Tax=Bacillus rossius redtenbacheri TaxID=93214 RepID=UPI002FDEB3B8
MSAEAAEDYLSSLSDLTINSKPLINMLTMLAEENIDHAAAIVQAVEQHLQKVQPSIKLPVLYLIDSIVKNVGGAYINLFTQNIVSTFCGVFEKVDERVRENMFKLRMTWNEVFPAKKLYALDVRVSSMDPAWPVMPPPVSAPIIHINRKFLNMTTTTTATASNVATTSPARGKSTTTVVTASKLSPAPSASSGEPDMRAMLLKKQKEFLELQQKKLELELLQTKAKLEEQQKALEKQTHGQLPPPVGAGSGSQETGKPAKTKAAGPKLSGASTGKKQAPLGGAKSTKSSASAAMVQTAPLLKVKTDEKHVVTPVARSRDPRLAGRQMPPIGDDKISKPNSVVSNIKRIESATPKPLIKENPPSAGLLNKESKVISRKDPRLRTNKVLQSMVSTTNSKGDLTSMHSDSSTHTVTVPYCPSPTPFSQLEKSTSSRKIVSGKVDKSFKTDSSKAVDRKEENPGKTTTTESSKSSPPSKKKMLEKRKDDKLTVSVNKEMSNANRQGRSPVRRKSPMLKTSQRSKSPASKKSPQRSSPLRSKSPRRTKSPSRSKSPTRSKSPIKSKSPMRSKSPMKSNSPTRSKSPNRSKSPTRSKSPSSKSSARSKSPQKSKSSFINKPKSPQKSGSPVGVKTSTIKNKSISKLESARVSPLFRSESPTSKFKTSSQQSKSPPQIPRTTVETNMNVFSSSKSVHRSSPVPRTASPVETRKTQRPDSPVPNLKPSVLKVSTVSPSKSPQRKKSPEPSSPQRPPVETNELAKSAAEDRRPPQLHSGHKNSLFDSSDSDSSTSSLSKFEGDGRKGSRAALFKEKKSARKSRHYRERASSRSPELCLSSSTGDVDLRQGGPPQKLARLATFQADVKMVPSPVIKEEEKSPLIEATTKDVDLRQLPGTPSKKRPSLDGADQPQVKKSKAEILDVLFGFGGEDVDLRQLPSTVHVGASPPSAERPDLDDRAKENEPGDNTEGWAKYKELKPDAFKSPRPFGMFNRDVRDRQKLQNSSLPLESPAANLGQSALLDRLGRPLLYNDPKRRPSVNSPLSPLPEMDTDMRHPGILSRDAFDSIDRGFNFDLIVAQADEQLNNGTLSSTEYNKLLQQMIQLNETHKLREAQRRDEQEKQTWEKRRQKKKRYENGSKLDDTSPVSSPESFSDDPEDHEASTGFVPPANSRFGDIDERFQSLVKLRLPPASTPLVERPASSQQWPEAAPAPAPAAPSGVPSPPSGAPPPPPPPLRWESPVPWRLPPRLAPPLHVLPPGGFHRPLAPGSFGPSRWRSPYAGRSFDTDPESRFDRYGGRGTGRFPRLPLHTQMMQHPPPSLPLHSHHHAHLLSREQELPPADPMILDLIAQDSMRTIAIDAVPRDIRFYGDTAVVILTWDNPREISFQAGSRRVTFDDRESFVCTFNSSYREVILDGNKHRIRLGAPTRELYIDGKWYECFFGGPPVKVELNGKLHSVKLEGPVPQVRIGGNRLDLVAGKVNLIIDARSMVPIFLDAKPQRFDIEGIPHILRFADALRTVLINGQPLDVEFGGLPKPIVVDGKKHFLRLSMLPKGVVPGYAKIVSMEGICLPSPPHPPDDDSNSMGFAEESSNDAAKFSQGHEPALPILRNLGDSHGRHGLRRRLDKEHEGRNSPLLRDRDGAAGSMLHPHAHPPIRSRPAGQLPLELLTSLMPGTLSAPVSACSYQVEPESQDGHSQKEVADAPAGAAVASTATSKAAGIPFLPTDINVEELFKKLVATGIVSTGVASQPDSSAAEAKKEEASAIKEINLKQPESLKVRQPALTTLLYSGIQCSSCGVRFSPEQTMKYSQHLDWHFRQNRRDRDNTRKAQSRKWYYDVSDWIQFEEIEDLEERAQSWFESEQAEGRLEDKEDQEVPSVPAGESLEDTFCDVCHDKFEQFYNEEREEWHLRAAVRVDGKTYHPICYEDFKASLNKTVEESSATEDAKEEVSEAVAEEAAVKEEEPKVPVLEEPQPEAAEEEPAQDAAEKKDEPAEQSAELEEVSEKEECIKMEIGEQEKIEEIVTEEIAAIKLEPLDSEEVAEDVKPDICVKEEVDSNEVPSEEKMEEDYIKPVAPVADTTHVSVACSIDGNVQFEDQAQLATTVPGKIKINITKPISTKETPAEAEVEQSKDNKKEATSTVENSDEIEAAICKDLTEMTEPPPPGVGPEPVHMKPLLVGRKLTEFPKVQKGKELSALCSIM